jgi:hypothetical protein
MMLLTTSSGDVFATGEAPMYARPAMMQDRWSRIHVQVAIADVQAYAVVDTGGAYLILKPDLASAAVVGEAIGRDNVIIRGFSYPGSVHRAPVVLVADKGEPLHFEATVFVPELDDGEHWPLPSYLGWQGCLERIRLALDPGTERAYFGALG